MGMGMGDRQRGNVEPRASRNGSGETWYCASIVHAVWQSGLCQRRWPLCVFTGNLQHSWSYTTVACEIVEVFSNQWVRCSFGLSVMFGAAVVVVVCNYARAMVTASGSTTRLSGGACDDER
jgi:hypothetical protein